jgi:hypothetical protein
MRSEQGIERGKFYRIKLITRGQNFKVYVNDVFVTELSDMTFAAGKIGLHVFGGWSAGAIMHFDNIKVYK